MIASIPVELDAAASSSTGEQSRDRRRPDDWVATNAIVGSSASVGNNTITYTVTFQ